jgi:hypothetical protein
MLDYLYTLGNSILIDDKVQIVSSIVLDFPYKPIINGTTKYEPVEIDPVRLPNGKEITYLHQLENYKLFSNLDADEIESNLSKNFDKLLAKSLTQHVLNFLESSAQHLKRHK